MDVAKGLLFPSTTSGEPSIDAEKAGSTKISVAVGKLEMNGKAMLTSLIRCFSASARSSSSILPPLIWMLLTENAGVGSSEAGRAMNSSIRSEKFRRPSARRTILNTGPTSLSSLITGPPRKNELDSTLTYRLSKPATVSPPPFSWMANPATCTDSV